MIWTYTKLLRRYQHLFEKCLISCLHLPRNDIANLISVQSSLLFLHYILGCPPVLSNIKMMFEAIPLIKRTNIIHMTVWLSLVLVLKVVFHQTGLSIAKVYWAFLFRALMPSSVPPVVLMTIYVYNLCTVKHVLSTHTLNSIRNHNVSGDRHWLER